MSVLRGEVTLPGFVDLHVHFREPNTNANIAETISSGTRAAMIGGFVLVGDMPNNIGWQTWSEERLVEKHTIAKADAFIPTTFHTGSQPESDNIGELKKMSRLSMWLKLYGAPTTGNHMDYEAEDFREIVAEWHRVAPDKPIGLHAGKDNLRDMIALIAHKYNHPLHIHHVNSSIEVKAVKAAQAIDLPVTCGVCPHHLLKTTHNERTEGWFARTVPPLAEQAEAEQLMRYLADGSIDIIETDHAPHSAGAKERAEYENPEAIHDSDHTTCFGVPGIDFAASLMFYQVKRGFVTMERVIDAMSTKPAEILGVKLGKQTNVTWDLHEYRIQDVDAESSSGWSPFTGMLALGEVVELKVQDEVLVRDGFDTGERMPLVLTKRGATV